MGEPTEAVTRYRLALEAFDRGIALDPSWAVLFNNRGRINYILGNYPWREGKKEEAILHWAAGIEDYTRALALDPALLEARYYRGKLRATLAQALPARASELLLAAQADLEEVRKVAPADWEERPALEKTLQRIEKALKE